MAAVVVLPVSGPGSGFSFADPRIAESSGLVVLDSGSMVTTNDSGDVGRVFVVAPTGRTVRVAHWSSEAVDQESLAPSVHADRVWVGDIGDNGARRSTIVLREVGVAADNAGTVFRMIRAVYPDRAHDAETLMLAPDGRLVIVTKGFLGGTLYAVPAADMEGSAERTTLEQVSSAGAMLAMATDGGFVPGGSHFLVRGYVSATLYAWPSLERIGSMPLPAQRQGEGMAIASDGAVWLTSEGPRSEVLRIGLSEKLAAAAAAGSGSGDASDSSSPTAPPVASDRTVPTVPTGGTGATDPVIAPSARSWWPWVAGGVVGVGLLAYLGRALRGPGRRTPR